MSEPRIPEPSDEHAMNFAGGWACLDCGTRGTGAFCSACGQRRETTLLPLSRIVAEAVADLTNLDGKLLATLGLLFRHPGAVTRNYVDGRRTRYVPPFRLFLSASAVYFLLIGLTGSETFLVFGGSLTVNGEPAGPGAFADFVRLAPQAMILLLPLFAVYLKIVYSRNARLYAEHLVFSLHYYTVVFLVFAATTIIEAIADALDSLAGAPQEATLVQVAAFGYVVAYLAIALRRVFGGSRLGGAVRSLALWVLFLATISGAIELVYRRTGAF